jgi:hypothetical protein
VLFHGSENSLLRSLLIREDAGSPARSATIGRTAIGRATTDSATTGRTAIGRATTGRTAIGRATAGRTATEAPPSAELRLAELPSEEPP